MSSVIEETVVWAPSASPDGSGKSILKTVDTEDDTETDVLVVTVDEQTSIDMRVHIMGRGDDGTRFGSDLRGTWSREDDVLSELRNDNDLNLLDCNPGGWTARAVPGGTDVVFKVKGGDGHVLWSAQATAQILSLESSAVPAGGNPLEIFGADLVGWLNESMATIAADGVWVDESTAAPVDTSQSHAAGPNKCPTAGTINGHNCAVFDGSDDGLNWGGDRELLTGDFTIAAVIQTSTIGNSRMVLGKFYGGTSWYLGATANATTDKMSAGANGDTGTEFAESDDTLADGNPHVLVAVREGDTVTLYVDGEAQVDTGFNASAIAGSNEFISVGCAMYTSDGTTAYHFNGKIGQPIMVNRAADGGELAALHDYLTTWAGI